MDKKIKITESQYEKLLKNLLFETPFDKMSKDAKPGDIISITWKGSKNNFKVLNNTSGQIIMDNIDNATNKYYRYLMFSNSLEGDDLELRRVHKEKEKDKLNDYRQWTPFTVKDITNIQIIRDGNVVDTVDPVSPTAAKQQQNAKNTKNKQDDNTISKDDINNYLAIILDDLIEGRGLKLAFNNGEVLFCCENKYTDMFILDLNKEKNTILPNLNDWDLYLLKINGDPNDKDLYSQNKDIVSTSDGGKTFNLKFKVKAGTTTKDLVINNINGLGVVPNCTDYKEDEGDTNKNLETDNELNDEEKQKLYDTILDDKLLQSVFYRQPSFWQAFVAELKGKSHKGNGYITIANNIVKDYKQKKLEEKIGKGWGGNGERVSYIPTAPVRVNYKNLNGSTNTFVMNTMTPDNIYIRGFEFEATEEVLMRSLDDGKNENYNLRILVKDKTKDPNIKICDIQIVKGESKKPNDIKGEEKDVQLKFLQSDGYNEQKVDNNI